MPLFRASRLVTMLAIGVMPGLQRPRAEAASVPWSIAQTGVPADEALRGKTAVPFGPRIRVQGVVFALRPVPDIATGTATMQFRPYVLFADGRVREAFDDDPDLLDAAVVSRLSSRRADQWGRWHRSAHNLTIDWNNGARDRISAPVDATPAVRGARLTGDYVERDSTFRTRAPQPEGSVLRFFSDGRFERMPVERHVSGQAGSGKRVRDRGRYHVTSWTLTLIHDDGHRERRLFYRFPTGSGMIGFGRASFMRKTTKARRSKLRNG